MNSNGKKEKENKIRRTSLIAAAAFCVLIAAFLVAPKFLFPSPQDVNGLVASEVTYDSVKLEWNGSADGAEYYVYRSEEGMPFIQVATVTDTTFTDEGIKTGHKYQYKIAVSNLVNTSDKNASVGVVARLNTPVITGDVSKGSIRLDIQNVEGAESYDIKRNGKHVAYAEAGEEDTVTFEDDSASTDKEYEYTATACRDRAQSSESEPVELELKSVSKMTAKVKDDELLITWEDDGTYSDYKLYKDGKLVTDTEKNSYTLESKEGSTYDLKLVGFTQDIQSPAREQTFKVMEAQMTNEEAIDAACEWGIDIANDDSFTYGTGRPSHRSGCHFCDTNIRKKGSKKYDKTYCCNPFVTACFAHGAKDPELLALCQAGHCLQMNRKSFEANGEWEYIGHPSKDSLKKGDVLVASPKIGKGSRHHLALCIGDGQIVHAREEGWDADSITVANLGTRDYNSQYDFVMRYTGEGGIALKAVEITGE